MNPVHLLKTLSDRGIRLRVQGDRLCYDGPEHRITNELLTSLRENKAALMKQLCSEPVGKPVSQFPAILENRETGKLVSEEGRTLLTPYLPVIQAAHRNELPVKKVCMGGVEYGLCDYICRISAGIWYGNVLDDPRLPDWLENLRRLQAWYECLQSGQTAES